MTPFEDDPELERKSAEAWQIARDIVAKLPPAAWPDLPEIVGRLAQFLTAAQARDLSTDVRQALNEAYFYGLAFGLRSLDARLDPNGLRIQSPPLAEAHPEAADWRLISFETALQEHSAASLRIMAGRFKGLADLCQQLAREA
jgi:hypothetical protein